MKPIEVLDILNDIYKTVPRDLCEDNAFSWFATKGNVLSAATNQGFKCDAGISKMAIILENEDFVIKIPFTGRWISPEIFEKFESAPYYDEVEQGLHNWNYCNAEVSSYEFAEANGVGDYFAREYLLGFIDGYPIYAQERADIWAECDDTPLSNDEKEKTQKTLKK